jgi:hypothetical protein
MLGSVRDRCASLRESLVLDDGWDALLEDADQVPEAALAEREAALQFDDAINIQYTSGTTGFPKGATLTHHNILNNGFFIGETLGYGPEDRVCIPVPFYHCFGMVLGNLACTTRKLHGDPGEGVRRSGRAGDGQAGVFAVRRPDDVHRRRTTRSSAVRSLSLRTGSWRSPCPSR